MLNILKNPIKFSISEWIDMFSFQFLWFLSLVLPILKPNLTPAFLVSPASNFPFIFLMWWSYDKTCVPTVSWFTNSAKDYKVFYSICDTCTGILPGGTPFLSVNYQKINNPLPSFFDAFTNFPSIFFIPFPHLNLLLRHFWWSVNYLIIFCTLVLLSTKTLSTKINLSSVFTLRF